MTYTEIELTTLSKDLTQLTDIIEDIKDRKINAAIIRGGLRHKSLDQWKEFMINECHLLQDRRHFGYSGEDTNADWWEISNQIKKG